MPFEGEGWQEMERPRIAVGMTVSVIPLVFPHSMPASLLATAYLPQEAARRLVRYANFREGHSLQTFNYRHRGRQ